MRITTLIFALIAVCLYVIWQDHRKAGKGKKTAAQAKNKGKKKPAGNTSKTLLVRANWTGDFEQYEPAAGASFQDIVSAAVQLANKQGHPVKFGFNRAPGEKQYRVFPGGRLELVN